jgi:hypothetical protein
VINDARFAQLERTFGELACAMRYFSRLPTTPLGAARHLLRVHEFPAHLLDDEPPSHARTSKPASWLRRRLTARRNRRAR